MAIERQSAPLNFQSPSQTAIQQSGMGHVAPDVNKFYDGSEQQDAAPSSGDMLMDGLLKTITSGASQLASQAFTQSTEESYLKGSAAAGLGQSVDSIESNPLTSKWATTGYADTMGRLRAADAEAQTQVDAQKNAQMSPQDFQDYLAKRRDGIMQGVDGMSMEARKGLLAQQLTSERQAIKQHSVAHQKFIIDTKTAALSNSVSTQMEVLNDPKTKADASPGGLYDTATQATFANIYSNIWMDPTMAKDDKDKLVVQATQLALANDHIPLYNMLRNGKVDPSGKGTAQSMLSQLPLDDQLKLKTAADTAIKNGDNMRKADWDTRIALMKAGFNDPNQPPVPYADLRATLDYGLSTGLARDGDTRMLTEAWANANRTKDESGDVSRAWQAGDAQKMMDMGGKSDDDGYAAFIHQSSIAKRPVEQVNGDLLSIIKSTGSQAAARGLSNNLKSAVASMGLSDATSPANAKMMNTVLSGLDEAERDGKTGVYSSFLSGFSDADKAKISYFRSGLKKTGDPVQAAQDAMKQQLTDSQMDPKLVTAMKEYKAKDDVAFIQGMQPRQLWGTIMKHVPGWLGGEDSTEMNLGTGRGWFEDKQRGALALAGQKAATAEELGYVDMMAPNADAGARQEMALANVSARTIQTSGGPLVVPHLANGKTAQDYFGVPASTPKSIISAALDKTFVPKDSNNRIVYTTNPDGSMRWDEYDKNSAFVRGQTFNGRDIAPVIQQQKDDLAKKYNAESGAGIAVKAPNSGLSVQFNGQTTALGVTPGMMMDLRKSLVQHEGVVDTPAPDLSGKQVGGKPVVTSGVGVSSHNPYYEAPLGPNGTHTPAQINSMFTNASNDAAVKAQRTIQANNLGFKAFPLMGELAYQGMGNTGPLITAMKSKDKDAALVALKQTTAFGMSQPQRQAAYLSMLNKSME